MSTTMLFDEDQLRKRINTAYGNIRERAKPKKWKSGKRAGKIKVPGIIGLPFTRQQLWDRILKQVGPGAIQCPYCVEIGRPAFPISLANCVLDHKVPVAAGGAWTLPNIFAVCADCNNCKGKLSYLFFIAIMAAVENWDDPSDRSSFHSCLRTHGVTGRLKGFHGGKKPDPAAAAKDVPTTGTLALKEDW